MKKRAARAAEKLGTNAVPGEFSHGMETKGERHAPQSGWRKAMPKTLQENLARQLCDSVDRLQQQAQKVEFWASAMAGFTQPVPGYDPETSAIARYMKPGRPVTRRRRRRASGQKSGNSAAKPASA
jgi:hypothetical protein